jgi:hypothetical protein
MGSVTDIAPGREEIDAAHEALDAAEATPGQQDIEGGEVPARAQEALIEELRVDGTTQLGAWSAGGKKPTSATITLSGGAFEMLDGKAYDKGDVVHFEGTAVVRGVGQVDKADPKTGIVVSCKQVHTARILDITVKGAEN